MAFTYFSAGPFQRELTKPAVTLNTYKDNVRAALNCSLAARPASPPMPDCSKCSRLCLEYRSSVKLDLSESLHSSAAATDWFMNMSRHQVQETVEGWPAT